MKRIIALFCALTLMFGLCACQQTADEPQQTEQATTPATTAPAAVSTQPEVYEPYDVRAYANDWVYHEVCYVGSGDYQYVAVPYYSLENVLYCTDPVNAEYQYINIYVPANYMRASENGGYEMDPYGACGVMGAGGSTLMFMSDEAPIVYINTVNGYAACIGPSASDSRMGQNAGFYYQFLEQRLVLVTASARGRTSVGADGSCDGEVPAGLVDLKAGVRWLTYNDQYLAGDSNKIVTIGVSAGGAMSSLLGASGNSAAFQPYFDEIGALDSSDAVWASLCYVPMGCLEFADGIAAWQMGVYEGSPFAAASDFEIALSTKLRENYIAYMQSLGFDLGDDGISGEFYEGLRQEFEDSFNSYIAYKKMSDQEAQDFIAHEDPTGTWLTWEEGKGACLTSIADYVDNKWNGGSIMGALTFDTFDRSSMEGQVFGGRHFSQFVLDALKEIVEEYPEAQAYIDEYEAELVETADLAPLYDTMTFIGNCDTAAHWRFNIGGEDSNIGQSIAWTMYNALKTDGKVRSLDYNICYGIGHQTVEYNPYDTITWIYECALGETPNYDNKKAVQSAQPQGGNGVDAWADVAGVYTADITNDMGMTSTWTLELKDDGTYVLTETGGPVDNVISGEYASRSGVVSCGPIHEDTEMRGNLFDANNGYASVWKISAGGGLEAGNLSQYKAPEAPVSGGSTGNGVDAWADVAGVYSADITNDIGMTSTWTLELKDDGTYVLTETGGPAENVITGEYASRSGVVSCGPIHEDTEMKGNLFDANNGYASVWKISAGGGLEAGSLGQYKAPEAPVSGGAASVDVTGTYSADITNDIGMTSTWTLELKDDGTYVLTETGGPAENVISGNYRADGNVISCGPINEDTEMKGNLFDANNGYASVWKISADGGLEAGSLGQYKAP